MSLKKDIPLHKNIYLNSKLFHPLKKILAIVCICALFAPTAARLYVYMQCTVQAAEGQDCDCNLSSTLEDEGAPMPEKQKEIVQQNDVKFIATETGYNLAAITTGSAYTGYQPSCYNFLYSSSVFHPPGIAVS